MQSGFHGAGSASSGGHGGACAAPGLLVLRGLVPRLPHRRGPAAHRLPDLPRGGAEGGRCPACGGHAVLPLGGRQGEVALQQGGGVEGGADSGAGAAPGVSGGGGRDPGAGSGVEQALGSRVLQEEETVGGFRAKRFARGMVVWNHVTANRVYVRELTRRGGGRAVPRFAHNKVGVFNLLLRQTQSPIATLLPRLYNCVKVSDTARAGHNDLASLTRFLDSNNLSQIHVKHKKCRHLCQAGEHIVSYCAPSTAFVASAQHSAKSHTC